MSDLADGLRAIGYNTHTVMNKAGNPDCRNRIREELMAFMREHMNSFVLIDMNHRLVLHPWDGSTPRRFSFIVDNPLVHYEHLKWYDENTSLGLLDQYHANIVRHMGLKYDAVFFPHAGPPRSQPVQSIRERDIDILFVGNIHYSPDPAAWREALSSNTRQVRDIALATISEIIGGLSDPFTAFLSQCKRHGIDPNTSFSSESLSEFFKFTENCAESYLRKQLLQELSGLNVHIAGEIPEATKARLDGNFTYHGYLDFDQTISLMRRARFVLNVCPKHLGGSHERIWYGMANGCGIVTTPSIYLDQWYVHGDNIIYTNRDNWVNSIKFLLNEHRKFAEFVERAALIYDEHHTWEKRVTVIDRALNGP